MNRKHVLKVMAVYHFYLDSLPGAKVGMLHVIRHETHSLIHSSCTIIYCVHCTPRKEGAYLRSRTFVIELVSYGSVV